MGPLSIALAVLASWLLLAAVLIAANRPRPKNDDAQLADWGIGGPG